LQDDTAGQPIEAIGPLVAKLTDADISRLSRRFAGEEPRT
jgi:hypothetical protein